MASTRFPGIIVLGLALTMALLAGCITTQAGNSTGPQAVSPGPDENTTGPALDDWTTIPVTDAVTGRQFTIQDLVREGRPVIIHTFAVWCPTCTIQLDESTKMQEHNPGAYTVLAIDIDPREDADAIRKHVDKNGFTGLFVAAPAEMSNDLIEVFGNRAVIKLPVTIVICNKKASYIGDGARYESTLKGILDNLC